MMLNDNRHRVAAAKSVIDDFTEATVCDRHDALSDLLCDLMHWAAAEGVAFDAELQRARGHFRAEVRR